MTPQDDPRAAEALYTFLKGEQPAVGPELPAAEAALAAALKAHAAGLYPDPVFQAALESRLTHPPRRTVWLNLPALGRLAAWGGLAAALLLGLVWTMRNVLPRPQPGVATPLASPAGLESTATPLPQASATPAAVAPTPQEMIYTSSMLEGDLILKSAFPSGPADAAIYTLQPPEKLTVESTRRLAEQLGIQGGVYQVPRIQPGWISYMTTDGSASLQMNNSPLAFDYIPFTNRQPRRSDATYPPAAERLAKAEAFLKEHGLLNFAYKAEAPDEPGDVVRFYATLDHDLPIQREANSGASLVVYFNPQGQITNVNANRSTYQEVGRVPIISAEQAWAKFIDPNAAQGITTGSGYSRPATDWRTWEHSYPTGQRVELFTYVSVFPSAEPGGAPWITVGGVQATGNLDGLAAAAPEMTLMQIWGQYETGPKGQMTFNVEGWQKSAIPDRLYVGQIERQGDKGYLQTADRKLLIPDLPADVGPGAETTIQGVLIEEPEPMLVWSTISQGAGGGGGGGGGGTMMAEISLNGPAATATPGATPTPIPTALPLAQPGQRLEGVEAEVWGVIYQYSDEVRQIKLTLNLPDSDQWPGGLTVNLESPDLEKVAAYYRQPVRVWGVIRASETSPNDPMPLLALERIEPIYPNLEMKVWFGKVQKATLDGKEALLFTDNEDGQTYVLKDTIDDPELYPWVNETVVVEGMVVPGETYAGLPLLHDFVVAPGQAIDAARYEPHSLTLPVIQEGRASTEAQLGYIEQIELIYYTENYDGATVEEGAPPAYVQPMWRFSGRYNSGGTFEILVQATDPAYLK